MSASQDHAPIETIEALIQEEVGRNIVVLAAAARGNLRRAAASIAATGKPVIGIITGFYVPSGIPPAAETDGPVGVALLALGLQRAGIAWRVATDTPCAAACAAALKAAGLPDTSLDVAELDAPLDPLVAAWREAGVTHALSIERCGRSADGRPRNARGGDVGAYTVAMDDLFAAGPWSTLAIGDGGNEIGMGALPRDLITAYVANGETIASVTPADHLVVAGVSNWGAWGLLAALALLRPDWRASLSSALDPAHDEAILRATVANGPAVDGLSRAQALTVDNLGMDIHHAKLRAIAAVVSAAPPPVATGH